MIRTGAFLQKDFHGNWLFSGHHGQVTSKGEVGKSLPDVAFSVDVQIEELLLANMPAE